MRISLLFIVFVFVSFFTQAQTKVYMGSYPNPQSIVYSILPNKVEKMTNPSFGKDMLFIENNKIYADRSKFDCLYTIAGNTVYKGDSQSVFDAIYRLENNKVELIDGSAFRKVIYTLSDGGIYLGDSTSSFDQIMCYTSKSSSPMDLLMIVIVIGPL